MTKKVEEKEQKGSEEKAATATLQGRQNTVPAPQLYVGPFRMMRRFAEEMEQLFEDFGGVRVFRFFEPELPGKELEAAWSPQVEVSQTDGHLKVRADLPGLTKENVKVEVTDGALTISGERRDEHKEEREGYFRTERSYGSFYRRIPLPEGTETKDATATFRNGVLEVLMKAPKSETTAHRLEIKEAEGGEEKAMRAKAAAK